MSFGEYYYERRNMMREIGYEKTVTKSGFQGSGPTPPPIPPLPGPKPSPKDVMTFWEM
jgi:hypothetical protein